MPDFPNVPPEDMEQSTDAGQDADKIPQSEVAYGPPPSSAPNRTCARCRYFDGAINCSIVRGPIAADRWCTEWEDGQRDTQIRRQPPEGQYESRIHETTTAGSIGSAPESRLGDPPGWKWKPRRRRKSQRP